MSAGMLSLVYCVFVTLQNVIIIIIYLPYLGKNIFLRGDLKKPPGL